VNETEIIYGKNPVIEAIKSRRIHRIWIIESTYKRLREQLHVDRALISVVSKAEVSKIAERPDHQGIIAKVDKFVFSPIDALLSARSGVVLALDGITDPRNLGAIVRSAVILGAVGIVIPSKNSSDITPVVCHASAGGTEHIAIAKVDSILHTINLFKERGFAIACADLPSDGVISIDEFDPPNKLALVMGSEEGLRKRVRAASDFVLTIPQSSDFDSFNVSVAAGIILWELSSKKKRPAITGLWKNNFTRL